MINMLQYVQDASKNAFEAIKAADKVGNKYDSAFWTGQYIAYNDIIGKYLDAHREMQKMRGES